MPVLYKLDAPQLAAVARFFSSSVIQEMARNGKSPLFSRLLKQSDLSSLIHESKPVGDLFNKALDLLKKKIYRHEYVYKTAIIHKVLLGKHTLRTASMLSEFRVGNNKADIAILNGTSTVYEIKSERDNLDRLQSQINAYRKVFAQVNIITSAHHVPAVRTLIPDDVGIMILNERFRISTEREAQNNPSRVDPETIFDSIHLDESFSILQLLGQEIPDLPNTRLYTALREIFKKLAPEDVHKCMVQVLKESRSLLPLSDLLKKIPTSLQAAVLSTPLRKKDHSAILKAVELPICEALNWT